MSCLLWCRLCRESSLPGCVLHRLGAQFAERNRAPVIPLPSAFLTVLSW